MNRFLQNKWVQLSILGCVAITMLIATFYVANTASEVKYHQEFVDFKFLAQEYEKALVYRFNAYEHALSSGAGLFLGSQAVSPTEWLSFVDALNIKNHLPGIMGLGYINEVKESDLQNYVNEMHAQGMKNFKIHPQTKNTPYYIIQYIAPIKENEKAVGLNIAFEKNRYEAAVLSKDTGKTTLTRSVYLVQDRSQKHGFLLLHPFYDRETVSNITARQRTFRGWIYSPFIADSILSNLTNGQNRYFYITVHDGETKDAPIIYSSIKAPQKNSLFTISKTISIMQRTWLITWSSTPLFEMRLHQGNLEKIIVFFGLALTSILSIFICFLIYSSEIIKNMVVAKTSKLEAEERKLTLLIKNAPVALAMFDRDMRFILTSDLWLSEYNLLSANIIGKSYYEIFPETLNMPQWLETHRRCLAGESIQHNEDCWHRNNGRTDWLKWAAQPWGGLHDNIEGIIIYKEIITERKETELLKMRQAQEIESLANILESSLNEIYIIEINSLKFLQVNKGGRRNLGYSADELQRMSLSDITANYNTAVLYELLTPIIEERKEILTFNAKYRRKDGSTYDAEIHAQITKYHGQKALLQIVLDVTERTIIEEQTALMQKLTIDATHAKNVPEVTLLTLKAICHHFNWPIGHAYAYDENEKVLKSTGIFYILNDDHAHDEFIAATKACTFTEGIGLPGRVLQNGTPILIDDVSTDKNFPRNTMVLNLNLHAAIGIPIYTNNKVSLVLEFFHTKFVDNSTSILSFVNMLTFPLSRLTERMQMHDALERLNQLNNAILESASYLIIATNLSGVVLVFNRAAEVALGYWANEIVAKETPFLWHDQNEVLTRSQQLSEEYKIPTPTGIDTFTFIAKMKGYETREWIFIRKDGSQFPGMLTVSTLKDSSGNIVGFLGVIEDITEKKHRQNEIISTKNRLELATRSAGIGVWEWDVINNTMLWDKQMYSLYDIQEGDPVDSEVWKRRIHSKDIGKVINELKLTFENRREFNSEFRIVTANNQSRYIQAAAITQHNELGAPSRMIGVNWDITEKKQAANAKDEFISMVSHELRTPLTSIRAGLQLALQKKFGTFNNKVEDLLVIAANNCERLTLLINDILDVEKIEAGKIDFKFELMNLLDLVESAVQSNEGYAFKYKVTIEKSNLESCLVNADANRILQVITNMLSNAIKFSNAGDYVKISLIKREQYARLSVSDNGPGIPEDFEHQIFEKFSQANTLYQEQKGGTGLGLNISKKIIEAHGGIISFTKNQPQGTIFYFELPLANDSA